MPLIDETNMPLWTRCIMYFIGLIWSFLGVAIVADIFMCAIEGEFVFLCFKEVLLYVLYGKQRQKCLKSIP